MQKLIIRFTAALITFAIGIGCAFILSSPVPHESNPVAARRDQSFKIQFGRAIPLPQVQKAKGLSDLSILVLVGGGSSRSKFELRSIKLSKSRPTIVELDLGEDIDNSEVTLNFRDGASYRVFQRYRTSMTISNEGPHMSLLDWRHFDSPWTQLHSLDARRFRTLASNQMDYSRFPRTTTSDIVKEVRRRVGKLSPEYLELVRSCNGPNDGACFVAITSVYLRVQKQVGARWIDIGLGEFRFPMRC